MALAAAKDMPRLSLIDTLDLTALVARRGTLASAPARGTARRDDRASSPGRRQPCRAHRRRLRGGGRGASGDGWRARRGRERSVGGLFRRVPAIPTSLADLFIRRYVEAHTATAYNTSRNPLEPSLFTCQSLSAPWKTGLDSRTTVPFVASNPPPTRTVPSGQCALALRVPPPATY